MAKVTLVSLLIALGACATAARPSRVAINPEVMVALARLQRGDSVETPLCLTGRVSAEIVIVDGTRVPPTREQTRVSSAFARCAPEADVVGWFHNHPATGWANCAFSETDLATRVSLDYPIMLLSCDPIGDSSSVALVYRFRGDSIDYAVPPAFIAALEDSGR